MSAGTVLQRSWWSTLVAAALVVTLAPPAGAERAEGWQLVDLGAGIGSIANAVNDKGHVVGQSGLGRVFLWRRGDLVDLGVEGGGSALDVNNRDEVVGYRFVDAGVRAFLWRRGEVVDLGTLPGGTNSYAEAVNDRGEVVGWSEASDGLLHAFHWHAGVLTDLGRTGEHSLAYDIDNAGRIVGSSSDAEGASRAVRWWRGVVTVLDSPAWLATAISSDGAITGLAEGAGGLSAGFVWHRGRHQMIPQPPGDIGWVFLQPTGINSRHQVVGTSSAGAFVWERGRTTFLPSRTRASGAYDINARGVVVGSNPSTPEGTDSYAVLWTR